MEYYVGNGVYDFLAGCKERENFFWTSGTMWLLVYGDEDYEPRVITVVSENKLNVGLTGEEREALRVGGQLAEHTDIPLNFVRFDPDVPIDRVRYWTVGMKKIPLITYRDLRNEFMQYGLRMNGSAAHKSINDKSSSSYHDWQRTYMGDSVIVSDIDLLRFKDHAPAEIIELKRSRIALERRSTSHERLTSFVAMCVGNPS